MSTRPQLFTTLLSRFLFLAPLLLLLPLGACGDGQAGDSAGETVVVYTALDRQFSEPILATFEQQTGIDVQAVYDTEATKTVGLTNRLRAEAQRPRCDVFWNNEILNTLQLKHEGLLQPCAPERAANFPDNFKDAEGYWYGLAARARVIIVNTERVPEHARPTSIRDLADPQWRRRTGIAKPLFGTTASHVACLWAKLGGDAARALLGSFRENDVQVVAGNKTSAQMVAAGTLAFGLTDTDDAIIELEAGEPVAIIFPDNDPNAMGTLLLPNTLALVRNCPHPDAGVRLINYLLSAEVEERLAAGPSAQIPLSNQATKSSRVAQLKDLHPFQVDFEEAADAFNDAAEYIKQEFLAP